MRRKRRIDLRACNTLSPSPPALVTDLAERMGVQVCERRDGMDSPLVAVGDVITLDMVDYQPGSGMLRMRVTYVPDGLDQRGLEWARLIGMRLHADGTDAVMVCPLVRVAALRRSER
jgi:hypothetical protein